MVLVSYRWEGCCSKHPGELRIFLKTLGPLSVINWSVRLLQITQSSLASKRTKQANQIRCSAYKNSCNFMPEQRGVFRCVHIGINTFSPYHHQSLKTWLGTAKILFCFHINQGYDLDDHWFWFRGDVRVVGRNKPSKYASGFAILGFLSSRRGILYSLLVRIFAAI